MTKRFEAIGVEDDGSVESGPHIREFVICEVTAKNSALALRKMRRLGHRVSFNDIEEIPKARFHQDDEEQRHFDMYYGLGAYRYIRENRTQQGAI